MILRLLFRYCCFVFIALLTSFFTSSCNEKNKDFTPDFELNDDLEYKFSNLQDKIQDDIFALKHEQVEKQLDSLLSSNCRNIHPYEIRSLVNLNNEQKLYSSIVNTRKQNLITLFKKNISYTHYFDEVCKIEKEITDEKYLLALKENTIITYQHFLLEFPDNPYYLDINSKIEFLNEIQCGKNKETTLNQEKHSRKFLELKKNLDKKDNNFVTLQRGFSSRNLYESNSIYTNPNSNPKLVEVRGYTKANGTYVEPHVRTAPNSTKIDNLRYRN